MCGRYVFAIAPENLDSTFKEQHNFHIDEVRGRDRAYQSYNIGPTNFAPVVFTDFQLEKPEYSKKPSKKESNENGSKNGKPEQTGDNKVVAQYMKWGFLPFWAKEPKKFNAYRTFNAKVETLEEGNRLWSPSIPHHRCIVPVQGYYEWLHSTRDNDLNLPRSKKTTKIPYYIRHKNPSELLFLAGLWSHTKTKDEGEGERDIFTYTVITGPAPKQLSWLHERMPIVVEPGSPEWDCWLDVEGKHTKLDDKQLHAVLKPYEGDDLEWLEVSQEVNKTSNDGEHLIKPVKGNNNNKGIDTLVSVKKENDAKQEDSDSGVEKKQRKDEEAAPDNVKLENKNESQNEKGGVKKEVNTQDSNLSSKSSKKVKKEDQDSTQSPGKNNKQQNEVKQENKQFNEVPVVADDDEEEEVEEDEDEDEDDEDFNDDDLEDDEEEELGDENFAEEEEEDDAADDDDEKEPGDKRKGESHPASRTRKRTKN